MAKILKILFFLLPKSVLSYMMKSDTQLAETAFVEPMLCRRTYRECMILEADRLGSMLFVRPDGFYYIGNCDSVNH